MTGTSGRLSSCAARQRRSPAMSSKNPLRSRTMSGCTMPCSRMESASSCNASAANSLRGCKAEGRMRFNATRWTRSRLSGAVAAATGGGMMGVEAGCVSGGLPLINAPRPRPNAGFAMRAECRRAGKLSTRGTADARRWTRIQIQKPQTPRDRNSVQGGKITDGPRERRLGGSHDQSVGGLLDAARNGGHGQGDDEYRRAQQGGHETTRSHQGHIGDGRNGIIVGGAADIDAAHTDDDDTQNAQ